MPSTPSFLKERNVSIGDTGNTFGFIYPASYDIAMAGMTTITLANLVNSLPTWRFERVFLPWNPTLQPLSMEHDLSLLQMDILGFTSQFEPDYLVIGWILNKSELPLHNQVRRECGQSYPPLVVGGPCAGANPFPLLDLVDGFFLGDAERSLPKFLRMVDEKGINEFWMHPEEFNTIQGFWTPHTLDTKGGKYSDLFIGKSFEEVAGDWKSKFDFVDLDSSPYPLKQTISTLPQHHPYAPVKGETFQLEIGRGCSHSCRFCMIGSGMFNPARYRSLAKLLEIVEEGVALTKVSKVDIFGMNLSDFPHLADLCTALVNQGLKISIATLRPDKVTKEIIEAIHKGKQTSLTIAPEAGSERLRYALCKHISDEQILDATQIIFESQITILKNFFLVGVPTETKEDRKAIINLVKKQVSIAKSLIKDPLIKVDANPMVPKWQTPLKDWVYHYLPENRDQFHEMLVKFKHQLSKISYIKAKDVFFDEFLAQTWMTHLELPVNSLFVRFPLKSHSPLSFYGGYQYLTNFQNELDTTLERIWKTFKANNWKVIHRVKATKHTDEFFTKQYSSLFRENIF